MIEASSVKDLREKTGAGMMDCKKALTETGGDFEAAVEWLRKKGLSAAAKKSGRTTAEGLVSFYVEGTKGILTELNSETDFVAKNPKFQKLAEDLTKKALNEKDLTSLISSKLENGRTVQEEINENIAVIGENIKLRRTESIEVKEGVIGSYVHNATTPNSGQICALVALESSGDKAKLLDLGKKIAMHIVAANPESLNKEDLDKNLLEKERSIFFEQAKASGKPDNVIEKMVEGRLKKFVEEVVLLEQIFVMDGKTKISDLISEAEKEIGSKINLVRFVKYKIGEGIDKESSNFADEVASILK